VSWRVGRRVRWRRSRAARLNVIRYAIDRMAARAAWINWWSDRIAGQSFPINPCSRVCGFWISNRSLVSHAAGIGPIVTGIPGRRSSVRVGCRPDTFIAAHSTIENSASIFVVTQLVIRIGGPKIVPTRSHHLAVHIPDVSSGIEARSRNEIDSTKVFV
jgi:hypothetical protein